MNSAETNFRHHMGSTSPFKTFLYGGKKAASIKELARHIRPNSVVRIKSAVRKGHRRTQPGIYIEGVYAKFGRTLKRVASWPVSQNRLERALKTPFPSEKTWLVEPGVLEIGFRWTICTCAEEAEFCKNNE